MKRNPAIELYRVCLTLGICWLHAITQCGLACDNFNGRLGYLLYSCVVGFVFISGWFGVKFKVWRFVRLWLTAIYAVVAVGIVDFVSNGGHPVLFYYNILIGNWFLNGYCVLVLLAPSIDFIVANLDNKGNRHTALLAIGCFIFLVFAWDFLSSVPHVGKFVPQSAGVTPYSGVTLAGIYTVARMLGENKSQCLSRIRPFILLCIMGMCLLAMLLHLCSYSSPFALIFIALTFNGIKDIVLPEYVAKCVIWLSPSMLMVFLLHANRVGFGMMGCLGNWMMSCGMPVVLVPFAVGMSAFLAGIVLDLPRRLAIDEFKTKESLCK